MSSDKIQSVLFCCDLNSVRSPMAEGICKLHYGYSIFVQSAGVLSNTEIDPFAVDVCEEIGVTLKNINQELLKKWKLGVTIFQVLT